MRLSDFGRDALGICVAAAMLAGCGGSQPPIGPPGATQTSAISTHSASRQRGLRPAYGSIKSTRVLLSLLPSGITGVGNGIYAVESPNIHSSSNDAMAYINNWKLVSETSDNGDIETGGLTVGPNHKLYFPFLHNYPGTLGSFDTKTKTFSQFKVTSLAFYGGAITTASDGTIWNAAAVDYSGNQYCYVEHTLSKSKSVGYVYIQEPPSYAFACSPPSIIVGPDSRLWWPAGGSYQEPGSSSGTLSPPVYAMTSSGTLSKYTIPTTKQGSSYITRQLQNLVPASDGNLWAAVQLVRWTGSGGGSAGCEILSISTSGKVKEYKINNTALTYCPNGLAVDKAGFLWMPAYITGSYTTIDLVRSNLSGQMTIFNFLPPGESILIRQAQPFVDKAGYIYYGYENVGAGDTGAIIRFKPQDSK